MDELLRTYNAAFTLMMMESVLGTDHS